MLVECGAFRQRMVAMKNLSGTIKLVVLVAVALLVVITLGAFAQSPKSHRWPPKPGACKEPSTLPPTNAPIVEKITKRRHLKKMTPEGEAEFAALLCNGRYDAANGNIIHMRHLDPKNGEHCLPRDCSDFAELSIKTDKVIASETAKGIEAGELTVIQAHATIQIAAPAQKDIDAVLNLLQ
jgi:hypothetical protein